MTDEAMTSPSLSLGCRFPFGNAAADEVCQTCLDADMRGARLSGSFRVYYRLRSLIPLPLRQLLQRHRRVAAAPRWYYPDRFAEALVGSLAALDKGLTIVHPWPVGADFAFVLTHDVETSEGVRRALEIADLEEGLGFRSSWNFVPYKYPIDHGLLRELTERGFEIGVHGYNHDGNLFASRAVFDRRVPAINAALRGWNSVGFRAPMVHRNLAWMQALDMEYDSSCFDADPYQAMPGGVGSVWPFLVGRFVELPYTLPQDHTLFIALGEADGRIWHDKLDYIARLRGMALMLTHPDYLDSPQRIDAYRKLLESVASRTDAWHALPKEVAAWWRERDATTVQRETNGQWLVSGPAARRARLITVQSTASSREGRLALQWNEPTTPAKAGNKVLV